MEVDDEIQTPQQPATKYSRVNSNGAKLDTSKIGGVVVKSSAGGPSSVDDKSNVILRAPAFNGVGGCSGGEMVIAGLSNNSSRFGRQWQNSSRIIRVSRASGGKDRHSKVWTAKGPRDRRIRLSVATAIQFYDLQDRLGYDQPSKAVEWLIKSAGDAINELPSLSNTFPPDETHRQLSDERRSGNVADSAEVEMDGDHSNQQQQMGSLSMSKSGCSSNNSDNSKGSGLSLSRSEIRVKARERARERTAKEKDQKDIEPISRVDIVKNVSAQHYKQHNVNSMSQASSFTQLLTAGINNQNENVTVASSTPSPHHNRSGRGVNGGSNASSNLQWLSSNCTTPTADYFGTGLIRQLGNSTSSLPQFNHHHPEIQQQHHQHLQQQFPILTDHQHHLSNNDGAATGAGANGNDYISSSTTTSALAAGFNRGTLQSNSSSPSLLAYLHRFSSATDGSSVPFFLGAAPTSPAVDSHHDHHQHLIQLPNNGNNDGATTGAGTSGNGYNLNFSISSSSTTSGLAAGFNRGTLQSNNSSTPSLLSYLQRFPSAADGSSVPFFLAGAPISPAVDNHHDHHQHFNPAGLQLRYGEGGRHSDQHKGKGKN